MTEVCNHTVGTADADYEMHLIQADHFENRQKVRYYWSDFMPFDFCPDCGENIQALGREMEERFKHQRP